MPWASHSHSLVMSLATDPMCAKAGLYSTPKAAANMADTSVHSFDRDSRRPAYASWSRHRGIVGKLLDDDPDLVVG